MGSHARHTTPHTAAHLLHLSLHLSLHLHHVGAHRLFHFGVVALHEEHDGFLELVVGDTLFDKERVFDLSLVDEHVDHLFHLVANLRAGHSRLLLHGFHCQFLRLVEGSKGLRFGQFRALLCRIHLIFVGEFALLGSHEHLGVFWVKSQSAHRLLDFLLAGFSQELKSLLYDDQAHLVLLHELI